MKMEVKNVNILMDLKKQYKENRIDFDPRNKEHRKDYLILEYGGNPSQKYNLTSKGYKKQVLYHDILSMMKTELSLYFCSSSISS